MQCSEIDETLSFYKDMEDELYEETRIPRAIQARKLINMLSKYKSSGRLLDVGAGSGIIVEEAMRADYEAEGIEPSTWLQSKAEMRGLKVVCGSLPDPKITGLYDVICIIDVLEHVTDPVALLREAVDLLKDDGIGFLVTPDLNSFAARTMGWKWWHFRVAHVGYFNLSTLDLALEKAGAERLHVFRPWWFFPVNYLWARLGVYIKFLQRIPMPSIVGNVSVPLNLFDSLGVIFKKVK